MSPAKKSLMKKVQSTKSPIEIFQYNQNTQSVIKNKKKNFFLILYETSVERIVYITETVVREKEALPPNNFVVLPTDSDL